MTKKNGKRYTDAERAAILTDMQTNGLTQVAAAKKHGISEVTLWKWRRDAKGSRRARQSRALQQGPSNGSFALMIRAEVQARVREMVPAIIREEIAQAFGSKRTRS